MQIFKSPYTLYLDIDQWYSLIVI